MSFAPRLLKQAGLGGRSYEWSPAWLAIALVLVAYTIGFLAFYPNVQTNDDEAKYLRQARLLAQGTTSISKLNPITGEQIVLEPSQYPVGTAALMVPFVKLFGWPGAYLVPLLSLLAGVLITARWIAEEGRSPLWSLLVLGFPASLVLGRVTTSDVPSLAIVALGLWLFWRGIDRSWPWWLAAGLVAGLSMVVRESNALPFIALFAGAVVRREPKSAALVVGGLIGTAGRLVATWLTFGDPFYVKAPYQFAPETIMDRLPLYALGLLVLVPGGLAFGFAYRGRRRPEVLVTIALFVVFFLLQPYGITASSFAKRIVVALRYFLPLLPLLAFAMAESLPRAGIAVLDRAGRARGAVEAAFVFILVFWTIGLATASGAVHPTFDRWGTSQRQIRDAIRNATGDDSILVTNWWATKKFTSELDRDYLPVDRDEVTPEQVAQLVREHGAVWIALLDRTDSAYWREDAEQNAEFLRRIAFQGPELALDQTVTPTDRIRIWRVGPSG